MKKGKNNVAGKECMKPTICIEYKKNHMAGVDLMDQIISAVSLVRKGLKIYYKKKFFRLIEIGLQNSLASIKKTEVPKLCCLLNCSWLKKFWNLCKRCQLE